MHYFEVGIVKACSSQAQTGLHVLLESYVDIPMLSECLVEFELHFSSVNKHPSKL